MHERWPHYNTRDDFMPDEVFTMLRSDITPNEEYVRLLEEACHALTRLREEHRFLRATLMDALDA